MPAILIVTYSLAGILILIGLVGSAGATLGHYSIPPVPRVPRIAALGFGISFFMVGVFFTVLTGLNDPGLKQVSGSESEPPLGTSVTPPPPTIQGEPSEPPTESPSVARPYVAFIVPSDGGFVQHDQEVRGTAFGMPFGQRLWLVVQPQPEPKYHPQTNAVSVGADGQFSTRVNFGTDPATNKGERHILMAVVASREADEEFRRYLEDGVRMEGHFPGLRSLPSGTETVSQLTVIRQ